jgi:hypothetical protein
LFGATLGAGACHEPAPAGDRAPVGQQASAVEDGVVDMTDAYPFAVGICGGTSRGQCVLVCSGALIAPNLVVTARHCVSDAPESIDCRSAAFGQPFPTSFLHVTTHYAMLNQSTLGWHDVAQVTTPADATLCGNDLALLTLMDNVAAMEAAPATPVVNHPMTDHMRYSTTETAIGYGVTMPGNHDQGTRRSRQNIQILCIPGDPDAACGSIVGPTISPREFLVSSGLCEGDSGSSAFEQIAFTSGQYVTLGVLSRGGANMAGTSCIDAVYTRLDAWASLVVDTAKKAAAAGNYTVPAWATMPLAMVPADAGLPDTPDDDAGTADAGQPPGGDAAVPDATSGFALGHACTAHAECTSNYCESLDQAAPVCSQTCSLTSEGACPAGFACLQNFCFPAPDGGKPPGGGGNGCSARAVGRGSSGRAGLRDVAFAGLVGLFAVVARRRARRGARR